MAWWWAASGVLFVIVIPAVVVLAHRVVQRQLVVKRSLDRVAQAMGDTAETGDLSALENTRQQMRALHRAGVEYADALGELHAPPQITLPFRRRGPK